jgi:membrane protease subunit (stomatin/prohibitin family)
MRGRRGPGLIGTAVVVGGAAHMGAKSAQRSQAATQQQPAAAAPAAPAEPDDAAQIQKYAALKGQGLITDEEFEAKKKQILGI